MPKFYPAWPSQFLDVCDQTLYMTTKQSSGKLSFCLDFWFGLFLFLLSVYLLNPFVDLLISLHSWLYAISPIHQAVESIHINYYQIFLLHLSSVEWRSCCDLCRAYRWRTSVESCFFYSSLCHPWPLFTLSVM